MRGVMALACCLGASLLAVEDGGVVSDGMALNEHFTTMAWFATPVDPLGRSEGLQVIENVTRVPVGLSIGLDGLRGDLLAWTIDPKAKPGLWGKLSPGDGRPLSIETKHEFFTGYAPAVYLYQVSLPVNRIMQARIMALMPGEGYATHFVFEPAFFKDSRFSTLSAFRLGTGGLLGEHFLAKDAKYQPDRPVPLEAGRHACAGGYQDVKLQRGAKAVAPVPLRVPGMPALRVFCLSRASEAGDLHLLYGLMNDAQDLRPLDDVAYLQNARIWVWPNASIPALVRVSVQENGVDIASPDADAAAALATLLPAREPVGLFPGEVLTWHIVIPAARLEKMKRGRDYQLAFSLPFRAAAGADRPAQDPEPARIDSALTVRR